MRHQAILALDALFDGFETTRVADFKKLYLTTLYSATDNAEQELCDEDEDEDEDELELEHVDLNSLQQLTRNVAAFYHSLPYADVDVEIFLLLNKLLLLVVCLLFWS